MYYCEDIHIYTLLDLTFTHVYTIQLYLKTTFIPFGQAIYQKWRGKCVNNITRYNCLVRSINIKFTIYINLDTLYTHNMSKTSYKYIHVDGCKRLTMGFFLVITLTSIYIYTEIYFGAFNYWYRSIHKNACTHFLSLTLTHAPHQPTYTYTQT